MNIKYNDIEETTNSNVNEEENIQLTEEQIQEKLEMLRRVMGGSDSDNNEKNDNEGEENKE